LIRVVVMGPTCCGKTTIGSALAKRLGLAFIEGDTLHPPANVEKMSAGKALTDEDRWPWLAAIGRALAASPEPGAVASCSALKRVYRDRLRAEAGEGLAFIFPDLPREVLAARIAARRNHFMPASLLDSQLATLEPPTAEPDALTLNGTEGLDGLVERAVGWLEGQRQAR
jgi:carbohydrate kinase (thermoresistant glucokinase family)